MTHSNFNFMGNDGLNLFGRIWATSLAKPKGIVHLVHGLGEHTGRYDHIGKAMTQAGYHLVGFDLRGHGLSEGKRGHTPNFEHYLDDVDLFLEAVKKRVNNTDARFLYGHSLGANIVINHGLSRKSDLAGIISTSPSLRLAFQPPKLKLFIGKVMEKLMPSFTMNSGLEQDALSRDLAVVQAYKDDVLVHDRVSAKLAMAIFESGQYALDHASEWHLPLLLMHGSADRIASYQAAKEFAEEIGDQATFVSWQNYYHETHNELENKPVISKIISWLDERTRDS